MSGPKDETRSQCLGDNKVFDEQPPAAAGARGRPAIGVWSPGIFSVRELGARARAGSPAGPQQAGAARAVLEGLPADLAPLSPERSPAREDAATAGTPCPAAAGKRSLAACPAPQPPPPLPARVYDSKVQPRLFPLHPAPSAQPACRSPALAGVLAPASRPQKRRPTSRRLGAGAGAGRGAPGGRARRPATAIPSPTAGGGAPRSRVRQGPAPHWSSARREGPPRAPGTWSRFSAGEPAAAGLGRPEVKARGGQARGCGRAPATSPALRCAALRCPALPCPALPCPARRARMPPAPAPPRGNFAPPRPPPA
uniref:proline-rich protein 2-like n=1 Tax=Nyctereutes procyonoides TaxID=34880 RepID=UPI00244428ED|nr:proline-rich protein 2-like [Nyctereutes procyonoides]